MANSSPSPSAYNHDPSIYITPHSAVQVCMNPNSDIFQIPIMHPPLSRPPSYKLDTNIDLDALEREYEKSIRDYKRIPIWRHQFQGVPLVFWLVAFVMIGIISLFVPQMPTVSLVLWLPLAFYFFTFLIVQVIYRRRVQALQQLKGQLAAIQQHRQSVLAQVVECPADHYFLHSPSNHHTHHITTLLPPPPTYQKFARQ